MHAYRILQSAKLYKFSDASNYIQNLTFTGIINLGFSTAQRDIP